LIFVLSPRLLHNFCIKKVATIRTPRTGLNAVESISATQTDARLGRIIRLLNDYATVVVSGTKIADEIGTTRSEVWRLVQQLRSLGVAIEGHPATGYRLHAMPDLLLPEVLAPLVRSTIFSQHIRHYFKIGSTNTAAMQAASEGAHEGTVFGDELLAQVAEADRLLSHKDPFYYAAAKMVRHDRPREPRKGRLRLKLPYVGDGHPGADGDGLAGRLGSGDDRGDGTESDPGDC